jgi:hypothetical protein
MRDWKDIKAAYHLFGMDEVTHEAVASPHWEATRESARAPGQGIVLFVQDLTELDFGPKPDSFELGFVGSTYGRGMEVQSTLCVVPSPNGGPARVVGLALQKPWVRDHPPRKKIETGSQRRKRRTEYDAWEESVRAIGTAPPRDSGTTWVSVGDRGSDIFSHLQATDELGWRCLVRSKHDRTLTGEQGKLHGRVRSLPACGTAPLHIRSRPGRAGRTVQLNVSYLPVDLPATFRSKDVPPLPVTCVRAWESGTPGASIEWVLLTTLAVGSAEDAFEVVRLYRYRWLVEEYHKCLKSGCSIEERQLTHRDRLLAILGILSIVAVLLLQFKAPDRRTRPPEELVRIVRIVTNAKEDLTEPSALLRRIAMLGGFIGRKNDGEPGWQTIWYGWTRLLDIIYGLELAAEVRCG